MKENQIQLSLSYHGESTESGRFDIYNAAANMVAFADFVKVAGKAVYGSTAEINAEVGPFRAGSFVTDIYFQLLVPTIALLPAVDIQTVLKTIKGSLDIWKHLKGSPPKTVGTHNGDNISITNSNGNTIVVNRPSLTVVMNAESVGAVERFVGIALAQPGIDSMKIRSGKKSINEVQDTEALYFTSINATVPETDNEFDYALTIEAPAFKEGHKWRMSDGGASFFVEIADKGFLNRVDQGEAFAKGDALRVRMRLEQSRQGQDITTIRTIVAVYEHLKKHQHGVLF